MGLAVEKVYAQVVEAMNETDEDAKAKGAGTPTDLSDVSLALKYNFPLIEEEPENELTEHELVSKDSIGSTNTTPLARRDRESAVDDAGTPTRKSSDSRVPGDVPQAKAKDTHLQQSFEYSSVLPSKKHPRRKHTDHSEDPKDPTAEPSVPEAPLKRSRPQPAPGYLQIWRPGNYIPRNPLVSKNIAKKLRELGLPRPSRNSMISTHSDEAPLPLRTGLPHFHLRTRSENTEFANDNLPLQDKPTVKWTFGRLAKGSHPVVRERLFATIGTPSFACDSRTRKVKDSARSLEVPSGRWRIFSKSCVVPSSAQPSGDRS